MILFALSLIFAVVPFLVILHLAVRYYPLFPDKVASHFDITGAPDRFMSRSDFFFLNVAFAVGQLILFSGAAFATLVLVHWLISSWICWMGAALLWLQVDMFWQSIQINLGKATRISLRAVLPFLGFTVLWIAFLLIVVLKYG